MLVTAILVAETEIQSNELAGKALNRLLDLANTQVKASELQGDPATWELPQVHAKNTMRNIFTETRLSKASFGFLEPAFEMAIKGFRSDMYFSYDFFD